MSNTGMSYADPMTPDRRFLGNIIDHHLPPSVLHRWLLVMQLEMSGDLSYNICTLPVVIVGGGVISGFPDFYPAF